MNIDAVQFSLEDVVITSELTRRPSRHPDYEAENEALKGLAQTMADSPETILQKLVETALDLCRADTGTIEYVSEQGKGTTFSISLPVRQAIDT